MKSGFIAIVGRPNVGKSTLLNKLVKEKVAIVSDKSGTTRDLIKGILTINDSQFVFVDTPGIHKPRHLLGEHMTSSAIKILKEVDAVLFLLDGSKEIGAGDRFVYEKLLEAQNTPVILGVNKSDIISDKDIEKKLIEIEEKLGKFSNIITISGEYAIGIPKLLSVMKNYLVDDFFYYSEDMYTDLPIYKMITEIVREKILVKTREEIPHSVAIEIINIEKKEDEKDRYDINIYVEKDSQKGIIIGNKGKMLKEIGILARKDIEDLLEKKIYLNLWVKVKKKWRKKMPLLKELGYYYDE